MTHLLSVEELSLHTRKNKYGKSGVVVVSSEHVLASLVVLSGTHYSLVHFEITQYEIAKWIVGR